MEILFNDEPLTIEGIADETTVAEVIALVTEEIRHHRRSLIEVHVDDQIMAPDDEVLKTTLLRDVQRLHLVGGTVAELIQRALADSKEVFAHIEDLGRQIAESLRIGKVSDGMKNHVELLDGLNWVTSMLGNLNHAFPEQMMESGLEGQKQDLLKRLAEQMRQWQAAQENQDWVGMADLLEYELPEILKVCREFLQACQR